MSSCAKRRTYITKTCHPERSEGPMHCVCSATEACRSARYSSARALHKHMDQHPDGDDLGEQLSLALNLRVSSISFPTGPKVAFYLTDLCRQSTDVPACWRAKGLRKSQREGPSALRGPGASREGARLHITRCCSSWGEYVGPLAESLASLFNILMAHSDCPQTA